jgi:flagellar protein FliS
MRDPVRSYREAAVRGASPLGLIVILYDEIVRSIRKSLQALETGNIEARTRALTHAVEVIGYLQSILDFEKGGDVARKLSQFYNLMRAKIMDTQIAPTRDGLEMLAREFARMGAAWQQAERPASGTTHGTGAHPGQGAVSQALDDLRDFGVHGHAGRGGKAGDEQPVSVER